MVLLGGIDLARNNLSAASNSYAEIQKQLDRYNKVFDAYSKASPETQIRAASVMRQALNEYNGLKKQQEENAIRIYEAQSWLDYYKRNDTGGVQPVAQNVPTQKISLNEDMPVVETAAVEEVPIITTETPGTLNNNNNTTLVEANALDTNQTMNVPSNPVLTNAQVQNTIKPTTPVSVTNYINSTTPKYPNTTISPVSNFNYSGGSNYGAGSMAGLNSSKIYNTKTTGTKWSPSRRRFTITRNRGF